MAHNPREYKYTPEHLTIKQKILPLLEFNPEMRDLLNSEDMLLCQKMIHVLESKMRNSSSSCITAKEKDTIMRIVAQINDLMMMLEIFNGETYPIKFIKNGNRKQ